MCFFVTTYNGNCFKPGTSDTVVLWKCPTHSWFLLIVNYGTESDIWLLDQLLQWGIAVIGVSVNLKYNYKAIRI